MRKSQRWRSPSNRLISKNATDRGGAADSARIAAQAGSYRDGVAAISDSGGGESSAAGSRGEMIAMAVFDVRI